MTKLSLYLATLLLGNNFSASTPPKEPVPIVASVQMTAAEQQFVDLINGERWERDLGVLAVNPLLVQVAREHSKEMYELNYFDHTSPTPGQRLPSERYLAALGYMPTRAKIGENLFYCSKIDVELGHQCLMNSHDHRDQILYEQYEQVGVGVYVAPDGGFYVTEMFLTQID